RGITADISLWRELIRHKRVGAGRPIGKGIDLAGDLASWIVAGKAHLAPGTVANEKILGDSVFGHYVTVVAGSALDVVMDETDGSSRISRFAGGSERGNQIDIVFERQGEGDWVRGLQV